jgi:hypothetical protein
LYTFPPAPKEKLEDPWQFKFNELSIERRIGMGSYGNSYLGVIRRRQVVVKKLHATPEAYPHLASQLKEEALILRFFFFFSLCVCNTNKH